MEGAEELRPVTEFEVASRNPYRAWLVVASCLLAQIAASGITTRSFPLFLTAWSKDLRVPVSTLQLGLAGDGIICALLAPLVGLWVDRSSPRRLLIIGVVGLAMFHAGISAMTSPWHYMVLYGAWLPISVLLATAIPANAIVSRWFIEHRGLALGITATGLSASGVVLPSIITAAMGDIGWRAIWRIAAALIAIVVLPLVVFVVRDRPPRVVESFPSEREMVSSAPSVELGWLDILLNRNFVLLAIGFLAMMLVHGGYGANLTPIVESRGIDPAEAGILLASLSLSQMVWTLSAGLLSDRFGNRLPLASYALLAAVGGFTVAYGADFKTLLFGTVLVGFAQSFWPLLASALASEFGAAGLGRAFGLTTAFLPLSSFAPFSVARFHEAYGSYVIPLDAMAFVAMLGAFALFFLRERNASPGGSRLAVA
jgi:MFS family permease